MSQIGVISRHPRRPERLALLRPDGSPSNWFGQGDTLETIRAMMEPLGYHVADDGVVTK